MKQITELEIQQNFIEKLKSLDVFEVLRLASSDYIPDLVLRYKPTGEIIIVEFKKVADYHVISQLYKYVYFLIKKSNLNVSNNIPLRLCIVALNVAPDCKFICELLGIRYVELHQYELDATKTQQDIINFLNLISSYDYQCIKNCIESHTETINKLVEERIRNLKFFDKYPKQKNHIVALLTLVSVYNSFYEKSADFRFIVGGYQEKNSHLAKAILSYDIVSDDKLSELLQYFLGDIYKKIEELLHKAGYIIDGAIDLADFEDNDEIQIIPFWCIMEGDENWWMMEQLGYKHCPKMKQWIKEEKFKDYCSLPECKSCFISSTI